MLTIQTGWLKLLIGWVAVFAIRLLPFRPANFEPMLATMMPFATRFGYFTSFLFGFFGIVLFDAVTSGIGIWTVITAGAYGSLGIGAHFYFRKREATTKNFLTFGVVGTVLYDIATGLTTGPLFFNQPFMVAVVGQIPFTLMHLLGTTVFTVVLSPAIYRWVVKNDALEINLGLNRARA
ncbi:MAG TPA: ECF transporter S component [Candidatus Paceibacterota bacterium]